MHAPLNKKGSRVIQNKNKALTTVTGQVLFLIVITLVFSTVMTNWMKGTTGDRITIEQLEIKSVWVKTITDPNGWEVNLLIKNSGTVRNSVEFVTVNGRLGKIHHSLGMDEVSGEILVNIREHGEPLETGETTVLKIWIPYGYETLSPGTSIEIGLKGIGATEYSTLVKLT